VEDELKTLYVCPDALKDQQAILAGETCSRCTAPTAWELHALLVCNVS
jgi:hypothetical protein